MRKKALTTKICLKRLSVAALSGAMAVFSVACGGNSNNNTTSQRQYLDTPVEVKPSEDFTAQESQTATQGVGEVKIFPSGVDENAALAGTNCITFFFKNPDITLGDGNIAVFDTSNFASSSVSVKDSNNVGITPMSDDEKSLLNWSVGRKVTVYFDTSFQTGKTYAIRTDEGCFMAGNVRSKAITENNVIFGVKGYGLNVGSMPSKVNKGDKLKISLILGGNATLATIDSIMNADFKQVSFTESTEFEVSFDSVGVAGFTVRFKSPNGTVLDSLKLQFDVVEKTT